LSEISNWYTAMKVKCSSLNNYNGLSYFLMPLVNYEHTSNTHLALIVQIDNAGRTHINYNHWRIYVNRIRSTADNCLLPVHDSRMHLSPLAWIPRNSLLNCSFSCGKSPPSDYSQCRFYKYHWIVLMLTLLPAIFRRFKISCEMSKD